MAGPAADGADEGEDAGSVLAEVGEDGAVEGEGAEEVGVELGYKPLVAAARLTQ